MKFPRELSITRAIVLLASALAATPVIAQMKPQQDTASASTLFIKKDLYIAAAFTAAEIAMFPLDKRMASEVRNKDFLANNNIRHASTFFQFFGGSGPYLIGGSMYAVGRLGGIKRLAELGLHGTEAIVVGQGFASTLKILLGRERPYLSTDTNPRSFSLMRGTKGSPYQSFPSGHSTSAFAAAAAVHAETTEWWPHTKWILGPILYGGAALVGLSRIYDDRHWASDVVMGAAIGTFAGWKTVRFNHTHQGNRIDRWLLGTGGGESQAKLQVYSPQTGGIGLALNRTW